MLCKSVLSAVALAAVANAHVRFTAFNDDTSCVRLPPSNSPVEDVSSESMACNVDGTVAAAGSCAANAGEEASVTWDAGAHAGPEMIYMAKVDDLSTSDVTSLSWFKIFEDGLESDGSWASEIANTNGGKVSFTIPQDLAAGDYLLRAETIGLHVAGAPQFYMGCAGITLTGSGSATPEGVAFPGAYSMEDAGLSINIYYPVPTSYTFPGPAVYGSAGNMTAAV